MKIYRVTIDYTNKFEFATFDREADFMEEALNHSTHITPEIRISLVSLEDPEAEMEAGLDE